jgi:archaeal flagellar protein FlaJ
MTAKIDKEREIRKDERQRRSDVDLRTQQRARELTTRKAKGTPLDSQERLAARAVSLVGNIAEKLESKLPSLSEDLLMSNYFLAPKTFLSIVLFATVLSVPVAVIGVILAALTGNIIFLALVIIPVGVFGMGISMPKSSRSGRANGVDGELAFVIGYLSVLITGGVSPIELFRKLSTSTLFPASAKESRRILMNIDILAMDPVTAIERAARYTPNKMLADFLSGYIAVLKIGGDIRSYMEQKQKEVFNHRSLKLKSATELVGTLAEAYLAATVVMGTSLFIMQIVSAMVLKGEFNFNMIYFYILGFLPMISGVMIFLMHSIQTKEPLASVRHHYLMLASMAAIPVLLFLVPLDIPIYVKLGIGLAISTAPAAVISSIEAKKKSEAERMLPSFVLDLAEIRKTGLAPEKCIEQLANRHYGALTKNIQRMATQVSWGVPLSKILSDFGKDLKSWFVTSIGFILLEVVEVGGGTTGLFTSLADFTQRTRELEKERRSMFRPYVFMPYIGAVLTVVSTVLIVSLMTTQLNSLTGGASGIVTVKNTDSKALTDVMLMGAVFQGWIMGIVGGKMAEWSLGAGYKHATILAVLCLVTAHLLLTYVKF